MWKVNNGLERMWKEESWPHFRHYSLIVLRNKYWVPFSVSPFVTLMSPTQLPSTICFSNG